MFSTDITFLLFCFAQAVKKKTSSRQAGLIPRL